MKILDVLVEYITKSLDKTFSYLYDGDIKVEKGYRVLISFGEGKKIIVGFVTKVTETTQSEEELSKINGYPMKHIVDVLDRAPLLSDELLELANEVSTYYLASKISVLQTMFPRSLAPRVSSLKGPKIAYDTYVKVINYDESGLTPKQIEIMRLLKTNGDMLKREIKSPSVLEKLYEKGLIRFEKREKLRSPRAIYADREISHPLTNDQRKAFDDILNSDKTTVLLEGVTGSGKTEVYLHLAEHMLKEGKNVIMLVPEINLTPSMVDYCSRRFGEKVAILHSGLTDGERYDEYRRISRGDANIVVGTRSAIFAPLKNIGLIIIDEEHVDSYKEERPPYYHAREVAIMRAKKHNAKVVLGSATPTLETKAKARRGVYGYAKLDKRINSLPLPKTEIINLADRKNLYPGSNKISKTLYNRLKNCLDTNTQGIILMNRRGYWTTIMCPNCGHYFTCPSCGASLTYHQSDEMLKCHHCGYVELYPQKCPECDCRRLMRTGFGTERVVKELQDLFPTCKVERLDTDVTKKSGNLHATLTSFYEHKADFLVGTQMIAKGHDFPDVTLSAVISADVGLNNPSYRAAERTFDLIAQAVGRSGRSANEGTALIQTYNPQHYAIVLGAKQDYESFYEREMKERKNGMYPPFVNLMLLNFKGVNEERVIAAARDFKNTIDIEAFENVTIIGPMVPYYAIQDGKYVRNLLIKYKVRDNLGTYVESLIKRFSGKGGIDISVNIDPLDY